MADVFLAILPLALASMLSPGILAVSITLLARKNKTAATALLLGGIIVALLLAAAGILVAQGDDKAAAALGFQPRAIDLLLGLFFLVFGVKVVLEKPKPEQVAAGAKKSQGFSKWLAISFLGNITNFDAVLLNLAAVREIFNSTAALASKLILLGFCDICFVAPALLPLVFYIAEPQKAERLLSPVGKWMQKYGRYLVGAIFIIFGAYLEIKGF